MYLISAKFSKLMACRAGLLLAAVATASAADPTLTATVMGDRRFAPLLYSMRIFFELEGSVWWQPRI